MSKLNPSTTKEHLVHIYDKIDNIEKNHLTHIEKEIKLYSLEDWLCCFRKCPNRISQSYFLITNFNNLDIHTL